MLTRLQVSGFKNLVDVDVRFGPFTCVAGANGVGKSNLFDAITFLQALADQPLNKAALSIRGEGGGAADIRGLFHRIGDQYADRMSFSAEMIIAPTGHDDLGQTARASSTFLRYELELAYRDDMNLRGASGRLRLIREELYQIGARRPRRDALLFPHSKEWSDSVLLMRRRAPFISTKNEGGNSFIRVHQERRDVRPRSLLAVELPRTVLSATSAVESPTVVLARQEMRSWRLLQLEPAALRRPDELTSPSTLGPDGAHLPATLYRLSHAGDTAQTEENGRREAAIYAQVANRLAGLIYDVRQIRVERDLRRGLLTLLVGGRDQTLHPARALSDGTLRFLALAALELDPEALGLFCIEEPENGIHPRRIPAILDLLRDIAVAVEEPVGPDNPLRQVIVNTHSPVVVGQVPDESLLVATLIDTVGASVGYKTVQFGALPDTWRARAEPPPYLVPRGDLLSYLNAVASPSAHPADLYGWSDEGAPQRRVIDRPDLQPFLPGLIDSA